MKLILVPDIFGCTKEFNDYANTQKLILTQTLNETVELVLVDPYQGQTFQFSSDTHAYKKFMTASGHDNYLALVKKAIIENKDQDICLVGFSAGASAIWRAIDGFKSDKQCQFVGFYPSQIRNYLDIKLKVDSHIIFPHKESHFDVSDIIETLKHYDLLKISHTEYQHGFMNPNSKGFNESAFNEYQKHMAVTISSKKKDVQAGVTKTP